MTSSRKLAELLKLPVDERADLAMALWQSLDESQQESELALTPEQAAELDRRLADHVANPDSGIPWETVHRRLNRGR
jgi:putative addiction module component (TIGR02574 family)